MHLADLQSKEDSCWSESSNSLPLPNSFSEMPFEDPSSVRSGFLIHQEEQLNQVISMAGTDPHPSDVPCLVETSMAHDGFLFLVSSSYTGDLKLLGSLSKALSPDSNPQSSFLPPPEMFESLNQTSAQPGRRANSPLPSTAKLGFQLLGPFLLGPLRFLSPLTKDVAFDLLLLSSRFERNSYLSYSSQYVCRLMEPFVRRLHLENNPPLLLDWLEIDIGNLFLDRIIDSALEVRSLNELGIMIQTIWRCDYRCIFRPSSSSPCMLIETPKTQYINLLKYPTKTLKFSGIMTPSPLSGSYHRSYRVPHRSITSPEPSPPPGLQPTESLPRQCFCFCPLPGELFGLDSPLNVTKSYDRDYFVSTRIRRC